MYAQCQKFEISTPYDNVGLFYKKKEIEIKKFKTYRHRVLFSTNFETSPIILSEKLWPVGRKYEIDLRKKVIEIFSLEDKSHNN